MDNKETKIVIAGFGGQGVVSAGNIIARACMAEDRRVTGMISYGAEMRGGTANTTIVISDEQIASPVVEKPDIAIILNQPSLDKFEEKIAKKGLVVINTSLVTRQVKRPDLKVVGTNATEIAHQLGNVKCANMVILGTFIAATGLLKTKSITKAIEGLFSRKGAAIVELNIKALQAGIKENQSHPCLTNQTG